MALGRDHDRATLMVCVPAGLLSGIWLGLGMGVLTTAAFAWGGLWLSPDLDTRSRALKRWGPLGWIWRPYRTLIPHRSLFSHGPLIGTGLRLTWLITIAMVVWFGLTALPGWLYPTPSEGLPVVLHWLRQHPRPLLAVLLGLETSVWLHLILDGDPLPAEWPRRWSRRRRR